MIFENAVFIKPSEPFDRGYRETNYAPTYSVDFTVTEEIETAELRLCALGIGYAYINGKRIGDDLFSPPWSDFNKTLWYMTYDIKDAVNPRVSSKNRLSVLCGNGFMNEDIPNTWGSTDSPYRDHPKMICELIINGKTVVSSGSDWRYTLRTPYLMNRYRTGVTYDMRIPLPVSPDTDISGWQKAKADDTAPSGVFRPFECEPIRECEEYSPVSVTKLGERKYMYDFGVNLSGYARITTSQVSGDVLTLRYAEVLNDDGTLDLCEMEKFYCGNPTHVETVITSGEASTFSTMLSYYGFRYLIIENLDIDSLSEIKAVFVHQDIARRSGFECSNELLNTLFKCGIRATYSNMFHMPTDCPTREKYGWMNDAQSSAEQILTDFHAEKLLKRWSVDICDALDDKKGLPGIVPTFGWGYNWGNGPVSDGSLFEQAYRVYLHSGDTEALEYCLPYFRRYFAYLRTREDENGFLDFGLPDWANPQENDGGTPRPLINAVLRARFARIAQLAAKLTNEDCAEFLQEEKAQTQLIIDNFIAEDGSCTVDEQSAVALLIYHGIYRDLAPLAQQLKSLVERFDFHHNCGMLGLRHLYMALNKCGLQEYGYRILTAEGFPSYKKWIDKGATTLWELWSCRASKNHHMYSDFMSWLIKTAGGINPDESKPCFDTVEIAPYYFTDLTFVRAHYDTPKGRVATEWLRENGAVTLTVTAPTADCVIYNGSLLPKGKIVFTVVK